MNPMDILGGLLKKKAGSSGLGGQILKDILGGGGRSSSSGSASQSRSATQRPPGSPEILDTPAPSQQGSSGGYLQRRSSQQQATDPLDGFEDMLRQAHNRTPQPSSHNHGSAPRTNSGYGQSASGYQQAEYGGGMNERTELIIRAMINAAKADGRIDQSEQDAIIKQLGQPTREDVEFLKREFAATLDLKEFVWSVPLGMEQEIYAISLMAINLDSRAEQRYLQDLAHGLRMPPALCAQIHQRFGVPPLQ